MPDRTLARLGSCMRRARKERGFTQEQLSDLSGVSVRHIAKIEKGAINPSFEVLAALVGALGTSFDAMLCPAEEPDEAGLQELAALYRRCPPSGRRMILAAARGLAHELLDENPAERPAAGPNRKT